MGNVNSTSNSARIGENRVPNNARIQELWAALKMLLAGKVDTATLANYPTVEAVTTAIITALDPYVTNTDVAEAIKRALTDYMTAAEVNAAILEAVKNVSKFRKEVVDKLPEVGEDNVIYLIPSPNPSENNIKLEYLYINGEYEQIGSTTTDMSQYWNKTELQIMTAEELEEILQ